MRHASWHVLQAARAPATSPFFAAAAPELAALTQEAHAGSGESFAAFSRATESAAESFAASDVATFFLIQSWSGQGG